MKNKGMYHFAVNNMGIIFETFDIMSTLQSKPTPGAVHTPFHKCLPMPW